MSHILDILDSIDEQGLPGASPSPDDVAAKIRSDPNAAALKGIERVYNPPPMSPAAVAGRLNRMGSISSIGQGNPVTTPSTSAPAPSPGATPASIPTQSHPQGHAAAHPHPHHVPTHQHMQRRI